LFFFRYNVLKQIKSGETPQNDFSPAGRADMIPKDPVMLLSFINLKLRDFYGSLEMLCEELAVDRQELTEKLASIGYRYDEEKNQFV